MIPKYIPQQHSHTCSLAVLRMVLTFKGIDVSETDLVKKVAQDYGNNFKNILNHTIAKLACEYGIETTIYTEGLLSLSKKEMFEAHNIGCKISFEKLTTNRIKSLLSNGYLIQTSIHLDKMYPSKPKTFHSILIYQYEKEKLYFHDPKFGESLSCSWQQLRYATKHVGATIVYNCKS